MSEPAEAKQIPPSWAVSIRVTWKAICSHGQGRCWQAALIPCAGRGKQHTYRGVGGCYTESFLRALGNTSQALGDRSALTGRRRGEAAPLRSPERASARGWAAAGEVVALCIQKYTKCFLLCWVLDLPKWRRRVWMPSRHWSVLVLWVRQASDNYGIGKAHGGFPPEGCSATVPASLTVFP